MPVAGAWFLEGIVSVFKLIRTITRRSIRIDIDGNHAPWRFGTLIESPPTRTRSTIVTVMNLPDNFKINECRE